jgi:endonuclease/exonuclease/phosphatase family metal-dependent hydrolase
MQQLKVKSALTLVMIIANSVVALITIVAAYGGKVPPSVSTLPAMVAMVFPACVVLTILLLVASVFVNRKIAIIPLLSLLVTYPMIRAIAPMHFASTPPADLDSNKSFTVLTYNVGNLADWTRRNEPPIDYKTSPRDTTLKNPIIAYMLQEAPDVACVQEMLPPIRDFKNVTMIPCVDLYMPQIRAIKSVFPNRHGQHNEFVMTHYPARNVELRQIPDQVCSFSGAVLTIQGHEVLVVSAHFASLGLNNRDKQLYQDLTRGDVKTRSEMKRVRWQLLPKLAAAMRQREYQAKFVREQIDSLNYENVIITGDFNDIPECYAMRVLRGNDFRNAFEDAGTVTQPTFHDRRFYFHIDHILYRGNMRAVAYRSPRIPYSDHYPVLATFEFTD